MKKLLLELRQATISAISSVLLSHKDEIDRNEMEALVITTLGTSYAGVCVHTRLSLETALKVVEDSYGQFISERKGN